MKKLPILKIIKWIFTIVAFFFLAGWGLDITPMILGFFACVFQILFNTAENKLSWARFFIPAISFFLLAFPVFFTILEILFPGQPQTLPQTTEGLVPAGVKFDFGPWFFSMVMVELFYLVALCPAAINILMFNKISDKIVFSIICVLCVVPVFDIGHGNVTDDARGLFLIRWVLILAIVVLLIPSKNPFRRKQDAANDHSA